MKKFLAFMLALIMVLSVVLVACTKPEQPDNPDDPGKDDPGTDDPGTDDPGKDDPGTDDPGKDDPTGPSEEDQSKAENVITKIEAIGEFDADSYTKVKAKIESARKAYDKLTDVQKELIDKATLKKLTDAEKNYQALVEAAELVKKLTVDKLVLGRATIDGDIDDLYYLSTPFVLNQENIANYTEDEKKSGGALVGDTSLATDAETSVTFRFLLDDEYLYICEERTDLTWNYSSTDFKLPYTGDGSLLWFTLNGKYNVGLQWNGGLNGKTDPAIGLFNENNQDGGELKTYECCVKDQSGVTHVMEAKIPLADLKLTKEDFTKNRVGFTFCSVDITNKDYKGDKTQLWKGQGYQMQYPGVGDVSMSERFYTAEVLGYNTIVAGTPTIDGIMDDLYQNATEIALSQPICDAFTDAEKKIGAGLVGDTTIKDSGDMKNSFRLAVDQEYLYIFEWRFDLYPIYGATDFKRPYTGDGSLMWLVKDGTLTGGIQWNRAIKDHDEPIFGYFTDDAQTSAIEVDWQYAWAPGETEYEYTLELRVPLKDVGLTYEDFANNKIAFTYCTVDIVNPDYNADSFGWEGTAYQMQYPGVNNWSSAYPLILK